MQARKQYKKLKICMIVQQLEEQYFDWSDAELQALSVSRDAGDHSAYTQIIVDRLNDAGMKVDAAYTVQHNKDSLTQWDETSNKNEVVLKPTHNHTLIKFALGCGGNTSQIADALGVVEESIEKPKQGRFSFDNELAYLIHIKYPDKFQYDPADVFTLCGTQYEKIYQARKDEWLKGRAFIKSKAAKIEIDYLEEEILQGNISKARILLTDELFDVYSRNKRRCEDAFDSFAQRKIYRTIQALEDGEFLLTVYYLKGESRVGKSKFAKDLISETKKRAKETFDVEWSVYSCAATNPLDNFLGEEIILMDDLRGASMRYEDWLKLLDPENNSYASARYRNVIPACRVVIITASIEATEFFYYCKGLHSEGRSEAMDQFIARIMRSVHIIPVDQFGNRTVGIAQTKDMGIHRIDIKTGKTLQSGEYVSPEDELKLRYDFEDETVMEREEAIDFLVQEIVDRNNLKNQSLVGTQTESEDKV